MEQNNNATGPDGATGYVSEKVKVNADSTVADYVFYFKNGDLKYITCDVSLTEENESASVVIKINRLTLGACDDSKITAPANADKVSVLALQSAKAVKDSYTASPDSVNQETVSSMIESMDRIISDCTTASSVTTAKEYKAYFESLKA